MRKRNDTKLALHSPQQPAWGGFQNAAQGTGVQTESTSLPKQKKVRGVRAAQVAGTKRAGCQNAESSIENNPDFCRESCFCHCQVVSCAYTGENEAWKTIVSDGLGDEWGL